MRLGRSSAIAVEMAPLDRLEVVAVLDPLGVPAVGVEPSGHVLRPGHRRRAVELDVVVVVEHDQLAQPQVAGQARGLRGDPFLQVAVGGDHERPMVDDGGTRSLEFRSQPALRDGHPDGIGEALAERAGRRLDARRQAAFRVARRDAVPLSERLEVGQRDRVAGQVEERVQQHVGVTGTQHEAVAVGPVRVGRRVPQEARPQHVRHRRGAHRRARVTRVRLLHGVDRQRPDGVDGELVEIGGEGHRAGSVVGGWARPRGVRPL